MSSLVGRWTAEATVVCEASSFQLEDTVAFAPEAAVLLNLAPDHLDRHPTYEDYVAAKLRIFANQGNDDVAVAPAGPRGRGPRRLRPAGDCSDRPRAPSCPARAGQLWWDERAAAARRRDRAARRAQPPNAMAAAAVCLARGIDPDAVAAGLRTFAGVAHRLELIAVRDGVAYVNDSKATNVASTIVALRRDDRRRAPDRRRPRQAAGLLAAGRAGGRALRAVYLIGEAAGDLAGRAGGRGRGRRA